MSKQIISLVGPGEEATNENLEDARNIGRLIAQNELVLFTGGRNCGVMHAASKGTKENGGLSIGILPTHKNTNTSSYVDIPVYTGAGNARNNFIVLSSQLIIAIGIGAGTSSEISLAIKANKPVILYSPEKFVVDYFFKISPEIRCLYSYNDYLKMI